MVGSSGAGKTTIARELAASLDVPHIELDAIFHQPDWTPLPDDELRARVAARLAATDGWVVDGNYSAVRELVWQAADTVVWFDRPRATVMRRLVARTSRRAVTRRELWNGNREPLLAMFRRNDDNIVRYAWANHDRITARYRAAAVDPQHAHLTFVRIATDADADHVIAAARAAAT